MSNRLSKLSTALLLPLLGATILSTSAAPPVSAVHCYAWLQPSVRGVATAVPPRFLDYRSDTLRSLEVMRNPETGLIQDKILIETAKDGSDRIEVINPNTSATNLGLDLLNQMAATEDEATAALARTNLGRVLTSLERIPVHEETGLFYSWYRTDRSMEPVVKDVSSVDNIHLALALWTIRQTYPGTDIARQAGVLFDRMDFSIFYDSAKGLLHGNLKHVEGKWALESYQFSNFGSEARTIYGVAWALDLFKKSPDPRFIEKSVDSLTMEVFPWRQDGEIAPILKTWDGGAFQLFLPKLLLNEERYTPELAKSFQNYSSYITSESKRLNYPVPAAFSASNFGVETRDTFRGFPYYEGKSGSIDLVSTAHVDVNDPKYRENWSSVFTPHAAIIASTVDPARFEEVFRKMETIGTAGDPLYRKGFGFFDGYHVKGRYKGRVVPVMLSLDQGMIALAIAQMRSADGLSPSARALQSHPEVHRRLQQFYTAADRKLRAVTQAVESK